DGWQRLAAKSHRRDAGEIVVVQLRRRVAFDGEREIVGVHADAVVLDKDQVRAARRHRDLDPRGASVERVLDQLLGGAGRTLDHLARGDAVDRALGKTANPHGLSYPAQRSGRRPIAYFPLKYSRARTLPSSTPGWSKGSTPMSLPMRIVSSMKCIISAPME